MSAHNHDEEIQKQFGKGSDTLKPEPIQSIGLTMYPGSLEKNNSKRNSRRTWTLFGGKVK